MATHRIRTCLALCALLLPARTSTGFEIFQSQRIHSERSSKHTTSLVGSGVQHCHCLPKPVDERMLKSELFSSLHPDFPSPMDM
ncbi:hypothetical protein N7495_008624 [Penicillium taxi]|uniref:uncharacterized protein n=1 Tax=Penicillium taxi TaxID=168475 RepID=UPI0025452192|nr:uncharacterized protein N7495_008624 [Penicillium taxi]KAJ5888583.1 hypothetical protein N7495_008624 [Penicillium taxi]